LTTKATPLHPSRDTFDPTILLSKGQRDSHTINKILQALSSHPEMPHVQTI